LVAIWAFGLFILRGVYPIEEMWDVSDVWTRYTLAVPSAIIASIGLVYQQREFRRAGMARFGRDALWAAIAFAWYGIVGQMFVRESALPPSTVINQELFFELFGFPVQLLRAGAAIFAAIFVIRFMRSFEFETQQRLDKLQEDRLNEAKRREALRGDLLRRVVVAQESERQRIARELHDETGQSLTAIGLGLRGVATTVRQDVDKAALNLRQLEGLVVDSLEELQRVIADLRPSHLDDLGLAAALRWYAGEIEQRTSLNVDFDIKGDRKELPMEVMTALFRVTQEALNNVVKHAEAQNAFVYLIYSDESATVVIVDDGRGFDPNSQNRDRRSWGLEGMRERASLFGGEFNIYSQPGQGTQVEVTIPYNQPEAEDVDDEDTVAVS
jgi:signal transduction histidine kinase